MTVSLIPNANALSNDELSRLLSGCGFTHCLPLPFGAPAPLKTSDGPSGVRGKFLTAPATSPLVAPFPAPATLSCSFDQQLLREIGVQFAQEAKSKGVSLLLSPNFNLLRDPRAGRNFEVFGEDPLVVGLLGGALVEGCQGEGVGVCVKHLVCNDAETKRRVYDVHVDEATLREVYLLPFSMAATKKSTTPWSVMSAYNTLNGIPCAEHTELIAMLRDEAVGTFAVMSDWFSLTGGPETALRAGLDLEMPFPLIRGQKLVAALEAEAANPSPKPGKSLKEYAVESAERLLELRRRCLSQPVAAEESERDTPELRETLYQGAIGSAVLLKNESETLPLSKTALGRVAVVGSLAVEPTYSGHSAFINPLPNSTPLDAIRSAVQPSATVSFHRGLEISRVFPILSSETAGISLDSPIKLEYFNADKSALPPLELDSALFDVFEQPIPGLSPEWSYRLTMKITPDLELPLFISFASPSPCTITVGEGSEQPLEYTPPYVTTEEFIFHRYKYNQVFPLGSRSAGVPLRIVVEGTSTPIRRGEPTPNGIQVGFEVGDRADTEFYISEAVKSVRDAEVVVVFTGQHEQWESEGFDRADITLPGKQDDLILALVDRPAHQKLVIVNQSSSPVDVSRWIDRVDGFLQVGIAGLEVGRAVSDLLFGDANPSGKLGYTWMRRLEDSPSFGNFPCDDQNRLVYAEGRFVGYRGFDKPGGPTPLFPFGFGLSYTSFSYNTPTLTGRPNHPETLTICLTITNTGSIAGREAVQLYLTSPDPSMPVQELKGFAKTGMLAPGQSEEVKIEIDGVKAFRRWDVEEGEWVVLPGEYELRVAASSRDVRHRLVVSV
ncbi:hypothetical protein BCR35DRAFT_295600 [Leucosporidium creatinivorum]|uniref:beta-glucosidase n=1 Tax=Leucosporidium creatinivorum TaxID=106004 RepID=A0A1Y2DP58_9BASI|nr:hypothetical protein BCR35DRAFT_295600 [Leucosporidium creatinivorum]